jgi:hypothetical protein
VSTQNGGTKQCGAKLHSRYFLNKMEAGMIVREMSLTEGKGGGASKWLFKQIGIEWKDWGLTGRTERIRRDWRVEEMGAEMGTGGDILVIWIILESTSGKSWAEDLVNLNRKTISYLPRMRILLMAWSTLADLTTRECA